MTAIYGRVSTEHAAQLSALENQMQYYDNLCKNGKVKVFNKKKRGSNP